MTENEIKLKHICPVCNKEFEKKVYKEVQAVYCSRKCAYKGRSLGFTIRRVFKEYKRHKKLKQQYQKTCLVCQKEFVCKKEKQKYCSRKCFEISHKIRMKGENNPAFIDGRSYQKRSYRGNDWETLRIEIYKRDKYICQDCDVKCVSKRDATEETFDRIIQCHHIENYKVSNNNSEENLITLCLKCHLERHYFEGIYGDAN